ncbi:MAG TPA: hypothetical protein VHG69_08815, partial [Thermoleophilaceae bacterium]|nr:hypothetical protein [Thermoleophilaceae bacterium]
IETTPAGSGTCQLSGLCGSAANPEAYAQNGTSATRDQVARIWDTYAVSVPDRAVVLARCHWLQDDMETAAVVGAA